MSVEDDLVTLYGVAPEEFTALRKELVAAAKKRGDEDAARTIAASRRPTTAAWVLNRLVRTDDSVRARLGGLTAELRAAHAAMDGPRIRELTRTQRTLIAELVRAAFEAAELSNPSAALREDVTGTLQAAIADPEVAGRLGRLEKAEQFSGFGEFGAVTATAPARAARTAAPARPKAPAQPTVPAKELRAARARRDAAAKADAAARKAAESAAAEAEELRTRASTALRRYQKILDTLSAAEEEMNTATAELHAAERAAAKADEAAAKAAADLSEAEDALADLDAG
ncbi:hypothetical protein [Mycolicibacterium diernhoferi]|uniref:Uncharacterized protein n=1 Tax=Mycolicibacterium diernhoferi TaxID=1801 RepID=A0A1Q4HAM6_9MYCO|nr:hypothetical protein [Mycolicibacterium diernhoferi]OJZ64578.1 hypothetical protein BRW64_16805 [Mycolicibacterium diernhoferi]OPE48788.1 hypothetical protein BV510_23250 [Mycolicibacterium diernhoferi]PEG51817.1 hypothetical protein CRI78_24655 [Mycolicibacterium diernhoferi]QYL24904.1 hypothetical protein K0O62_11970 [Mycolicibacterium diernhoferi]